MPYFFFYYRNIIDLWENYLKCIFDTIEYKLLKHDLHTYNSVELNAIGTKGIKI